MKAYTDIEQSKKLVEILPIESADMRYAPFGDTHPWFWDNNLLENGAIPCWSLAALLNTLPVSVDEGRHCLALINSNPNGDIDWLCCYEDDNGNTLMECYADNQVDACVEMILKLNEQKTLTNMDYKEKYNVAIERAKKLAIDGYLDAIAINDIFPELKESEDDKIRRELIEALKQLDREKCPVDTYHYLDWANWLEKQGGKNMLNADEVIEWIDEHVPTKFEDMANYVEDFKQYFGL